MQITVYLTGGIAAYKAVQVVRGLEKEGHQVRVVMTKNAEKFVTRTTLAALTKQTVLDDLWSKENEAKIAHVSLAKWTQLSLVVPASANFIAKMALGLADNAASTTILATAAPKLIIPAMNDQMWHNPATQRNLALLKEDGVHIMAPATGMLAEGYAGKGRMPEPKQILNWVNKFLNRENRLAGQKIVVTAGGTREPIDPVRYIGNNSSGKMGIAIAKAARDEGADVVLIYGSVSIPLPTGIKLVSAPSSEDMAQAVIKEFADAQALFMAAAVADWRAEKVADHKLKKHADESILDLKLVKTKDILKEVAHHKKAGQKVIGFAAETNDLLHNAEIKLKNKGADYIVANDVSKDVFGSDEDQVTILQPNRTAINLPRMTKKKIAEYLLNLVQYMYIVFNNRDQQLIGLKFALD